MGVGRTSAQAERIVRGVDWELGALLVLTGIALLIMQLWIIGLILLGGGMIVLGAAAGKLK
jgi:hypothetical protein